MNVAKLSVVTGDHVPAFKNRKRAIIDRFTGKPRTLTEPSVKKRMERLENSIVCALYSSCQTPERVTDLEWLKRLQTALFGLLDDSLAVIPEFSFGVRRVPKGQEGVEIEIERIL
jgi:hypothetical protein